MRGQTGRVASWIDLGRNPDRAKALVLTGPVAVASVLAVAAGGAHLGASPDATRTGAGISGVAALAACDPGPPTTGTVGVRVRPSSALEQMTGMSSVNLTVAEGTTIAALLDHLRERCPGFAPMRWQVIAVIDDAMQSGGRVLVNGDRVDLISGMAGG